MTKKRPHILLITTDQQRFDAVGFNGNPRLQTPNLDALARNGVNFSRCYSTCPVCIPARRTLLSGEHPFTHGMRGYRDGVDYDPPFTLPGILRDAGYQTQLVGKLHLHPQGKRYGYDNMVLSETSNWRPDSHFQKRNDYVKWLRENGVQDHPHSHGINGNGRLVSSWPMEARYHHNNWLAMEATRFLCEDRDPTMPFFLHLSFFHPHPPLVPLDDYLQRYVADTREEGSWMGEWAIGGGVEKGLAPDTPVGPFDAREIRRARDGYYALINHIDDCIAHVLERWREYGNPRASEPLLVVFSSDHGEMLGDHHLFRKSLPYEGSAHIPMIIGGYNLEMSPGVCEDLCCWEDVLPTLAEFAGVEVPGTADGRSLAPALRGEPCEPRESLIGMCEGPMENYFHIQGRMKYIWFPKTGEEQLFDVAADPQERTDVSSKTHLLTPHRTEMQRILSEQGGPDYQPEACIPCNNRPPRALYDVR